MAHEGILSIKHHAMKMCGELKVWLHAFLNLAQMNVQLQDLFVLLSEI